MRVRLHPAVHLDIFEIMDHDEVTSGTVLAGEFYDEFLRCAKEIALRPRSFALDNNDLRRFNLHKFPHHILFDIEDEKRITILVVKHDHRDPQFGIDRR